MARFEATVWRCHPDKDVRELISAWSDSDEEKALEAAGRYVESYAAKGYELTPEELADGTRIVRATKDGETLVIQVEARER